MPIPSQADYERRELDDAARHEREVNRAPLADRREAQAEMLDAMANRPEVVAERVGWLLDGNYGYGPMLLAKRILHAKRMNRWAALVQEVGVREWACPRDMTRAAWKKMTKSQQTLLDAAVDVVIAAAEKEEEEGG